MKRHSPAALNVPIFLAVLAAGAFPGAADSADPVSPGDILSSRSISDIAISPGGEWIAYTVSVPRESEDEPGGAYNELYVVSASMGTIRPFITGEADISSPAFSPDGALIAFLMKRGDSAKTQVWTIPVDGGEAACLTSSGTDVASFAWHPEGTCVAYRALEPEDEKLAALSKKGYGFIYYEEGLRNNNLYLTSFAGREAHGETKQLTFGINVNRFVFSPDGNKAALSITPRNNIDDIYMFPKLHILDIESGKIERIGNNEGKLGDFEFSPDGSRLAYCGALELRDHSVSQAYVIDIAGGGTVNLTEPGFRGHISGVGWKDPRTVVFLSSEGVWNRLSTVSASGGKRKIILDGGKAGIVFEFPSFTKNFRHFAFKGSAPDIIGDLFYWKEGSGDLKRLTALNPWTAERKLGRQEVITYKARDGLEIEGILVYPVGYAEGKRYPLIVAVHGGPEAHYSNKWIGGYLNPAQVLAGKGYLAFYPNYRASTGYGTEFALQGYKDAAGKEFDDLADGMDHLVAMGLADRERMGMGGGSYGGYAAAWFASYYTGYVKAVCMFAGISDLISKRSTTDIPYEELYVHSGEKLDSDWAQWEFALKRSPIFYAKQSRTAILIAGGTADTRVHPSQSIEFYRQLKMNSHPAVRLVQYPGEGHGNRKQPARIDLINRHLQWYDWYVMDLNPIEGPMPPLLIEESYGLEPETGK